MKRALGLILVFFLISTGLKAMSYEEASDRARFLTDKMAYELNLNDQQYNDAYEINLDYLLSIRTADDVQGVYLETRNADLRYILYDWQWELFRAATYFFIPVIWRAAGWYFPIFAVYTPNIFYFSPPRVFGIYRGGHRVLHGRGASYYVSRRPAWNGGMRGTKKGAAVGYPTHQPSASVRSSSGSNGYHFERVNGSKSSSRQSSGKGTVSGKTGSSKAGTSGRSGVTSGKTGNSKAGSSASPSRSGQSTSKKSNKSTTKSSQSGSQSKQGAAQKSSGGNSQKSGQKSGQQSRTQSGKSSKTSKGGLGSHMSSGVGTHQSQGLGVSRSSGVGSHMSSGAGKTH